MFVVVLALGPSWNTVLQPKMILTTTTTKRIHMIVVESLPSL
jgi:hypothetical protein